MKEVKLTLVEHTQGKEDQTIAYVKATKHGKQAELRFIGNNRVMKFPTLNEAWAWLQRNTYRNNPCTYFLSADSIAAM
jgi:hypothetical protein|nr:MAG TPA: hypothetical protein [Caudoviricetes sp.]DAR64570.1 MAG TPA: hypothetical protein [Caudoviricetes sp.]DAS25225.1 MAG TPA: hypothetical protein [Bacteriophage sp.]